MIKNRTELSSGQVPDTITSWLEHLRPKCGNTVVSWHKSADAPYAKPRLQNLTRPSRRIPHVVMNDVGDEIVHRASVS